MRLLWFLPDGYALALARLFVQFGRRVIDPRDVAPMDSSWLFIAVEKNNDCAAEGGDYGDGSYLVHQPRVSSQAKLSDGHPVI
jgi:hypothetical protein